MIGANAVKTSHFTIVISKLVKKPTTKEVPYFHKKS
jgi:hypothetical protein